MWLFDSTAQSAAPFSPFLPGDRVVIRALAVEGEVHSLHNGLILVVEDNGCRQLWRPHDLGLIAPRLPQDEPQRMSESEFDRRLAEVLFSPTFTRWALVSVLCLLLLVVVSQIGHVRGWWR